LIFLPFALAFSNLVALPVAYRSCYSVPIFSPVELGQDPPPNHLTVLDIIIGKAAEQKSLQVSITNTYGLSRIDWDTTALNAAGGKSVQNGSD
jgi:hypothetical protein